MSVLLISLLRFGAYWAYDIPGSLNTQLMAHFELPFETWQCLLSWLYVVYSLPNIVLPFFSTQISSKVGGLNRLLVLSSALVLVGQMIVQFGFLLKSQSILLSGRILFGFGGEVLGVAQAALVSRLFKGQRVVLSMSANSIVSTLGSVLCSSMSPVINSVFGLNAAITAATAACLLSFLVALAIMYRDIPIIQNVSESSPLIGDDNARDEFPLESSKLPFAFWTLAALFFMDYSMVCFNNTASAFLIYKWYPNDPVGAGFAMSIPTIISSILIPILGTFVSPNKTGSILISISFGCLGICHLVLGLSGTTAAMFLLPFTLSLVGVSYAVNTVLLWPFVSKVVGLNNATKAYGICTALFNLALVVVPLCVAQILGQSRESQGTKWMQLEFFYVSIGMSGCIGGMLLLYCF